MTYAEEHIYVEAKTGGSSDGNPLAGRDAMRRALDSAFNWREGVAPVTLAKRIRWIREQRHQTRGEFAKMVGVSRSLVSLWESEQRNVSVEHLMVICERGGISLDFMVNSALLPTLNNFRAAIPHVDGGLGENL
jgi:DNA-binding XRE family transcriptional regulator